MQCGRVQKCLCTLGFDVIGSISANMSSICKALLGPSGLMSSNNLEQEAALHALPTLMSMAPGDTYTEFEKHLNNLPDRCAHDALSKNDIQIFRTPEGVLSTKQGVYVSESVAAKNTKQAKGRFRIYDNDDDDVSSNNSVKRESASNAGRKVSGKPTEKADKGKTAKEEAREVQLQEEALLREKVVKIQKNLSLMLQALGEMAIANPTFTRSQLPSLVRFVKPLLCSPIVSDVAYETMVKLAKCTAAPLCGWALDIATALRLILTEKADILWDMSPSINERETKDNHKPSLGLFERVVNGLSTSCKSGPLPVDTFTFVFPIIEKILMSSKKTGFHDNILQVLFLHMDSVLPLPRLRMLSVLYHVLGVDLAYRASIAPALNKLCLGLQSDELAHALCGVYAENVYVRMAYLNAVKCVPAVASRSLPQDAEVATSIWIALHDSEKSVAGVAEDVWDCYSHEFGTNYSGLFRALSNINYNVRLAAAKALAASLDKNPDTIQETLSTLFLLYTQHSGVGEDNIDAGWFGRQGIALALHSVADVLRTKDLPIVITWIISRALADSNIDVRGRMIDAGIVIIDKHGRNSVTLLFPIFENYLKKKASDDDLVREGVVIFIAALAKHLDKVDLKVHAVVNKLLDVLKGLVESSNNETLQSGLANARGHLEAKLGKRAGLG